MRELTTGELRCINESTQGWRMLVDMIADSIGTLPDGLSEHIEELEDGYRAGFDDYYRKAVEAEDGRDADELAADFSEIWDSEHPEYFDMRALFADCSAEGLERAEESFKYAESLIQ